ncbi:histidine phosphatase family protein [Novosphingobium sp. KCTC 2891]|uniref:histidine phosphatase family protein n=1 Tax=Novosphingobium sp. KCTC 2891 TaxID=2989730 RepID=UPI002221F517|nr:phosphoglycerate mutase family protein [Novosphingobium sp. KCTC 2891]MCW1382910.1 histidine phosphatase family protein [Novosphingobium sp. KCTC 2891]
MKPGRFFIMRHGETVYNAARRLQANHIHTPLTRLGCEQATAMGQALRAELGERPPVVLHVSETGRALQTAALVAEELGIDWFVANRTHDLKEIDMGSWCERSYDDVEAEHGPIVISDHLLRPAPDGEDYPAIAARLTRWIESVDHDGRDHVVVMHGISSRVLRGLMAGYPVNADHGVPIAPSLVQGSIALVENGAERVLFGSDRGTEHA